MATIRGKIWMRNFLHKNALDMDIEDTIPEIAVSVHVIRWPNALNYPMQIRNFLSDEIVE